MGYEYHFGIIGVLFNGRTGSLTAAAYWVAQILGSFILQGFLDWGAMTRQRRMYMSLAGIIAYVAVTWAFGGYVQYCFGVSSDKQALDFAGELRSPIPAMLCLFASFLLGVFAKSYVLDYWVNIALILLLIAPTFLAVRSIFSSDDQESCRKQAAAGDLDGSDSQSSSSGNASGISDGEVVVAV